MVILRDALERIRLMKHGSSTAPTKRKRSDDVGDDDPNTVYKKLKSGSSTSKVLGSSGNIQSVREFFAFFEVC